MNAARSARDREQGKNFVAPAGAAVVLDPRDGSVRALASAPTFDPASFVGGISTEQFQALNLPDSHQPLNNRAIAGDYAPGSTFKLATAIAALSTGMLDPRTTVNDGGTYKVKNCVGERCVFQNALKEAHGLVNLQRAITVSSDVFFYGLGDQFWQRRATLPNAIQNAATGLGLGNKTGIGLLGEHAGRVPTPASLKALHDANPKAFPNGGEWRTGNNINLSIGQGELVVTPLQLAQAYAAFAEKGHGYVPRVASEALTTTAKGATVAATFGPKAVAGTPIDDAVMGPIVAGLRGVVTDPKGTAVNAFAGFPLSQFPIAGKTGTAQVRGKQDTALFAAYAPANDPQWAISVVLEEAGFGGSVAAPVARRIFDAILGRADDAAADVVNSGAD
jgi:penicillin-binding protein 2